MYKNSERYEFHLRIFVNRRCAKKNLARTPVSDTVATTSSISAGGYWRPPGIELLSINKKHGLIR
jgi:hypothetical protein